MRKMDKLQEREGDTFERWVNDIVHEADVMIEHYGLEPDDHDVAIRLATRSYVLQQYKPDLFLVAAVSAMHRVVFDGQTMEDVVEQALIEAVSKEMAKR